MTRLLVHRVLTLICACSLNLTIIHSAFSQTDAFENAPISYSKSQANDPVAKWITERERSDKSLEFDPKFGYLPSILRELNIPIESQTLVFSKTSLQIRRISPRYPRALYFNDDVYVGYCHRGDVLEIAATDPQLGAVFYSLSQTESQPTLKRDRGECLSCHATGRTQNVPGYLVRSVYPGSSGHPILQFGTHTTLHSSPLDERFGGWYVTGKIGEITHLGNKIFTEPPRESTTTRDDQDESPRTAEFTPSYYLSPHSDVVALLVLGHQSQMHNAIAAANFETRRAILQSNQMNELLDREPGFLSESANRRIDSVANRVLEHLLMCDEPSLPNQIVGSSDFAKQFARSGIKDSKGRSLKQFDLRRRLFRFPCSYLIYSEAFAGLPEVVRHRIIDELSSVLSGENDSEKFSHLSDNDKTAIHEILRETLPDWFTQPSR